MSAAVAYDAELEWAIASEPFESVLRLAAAKAALSEDRKQLASEQRIQVARDASTIPPRRGSK